MTADRDSFDGIRNFDCEDAAEIVDSAETTTYDVPELPEGLLDFRQMNDRPNDDRVLIYRQQDQARDVLRDDSPGIIVSESALIDLKEVQ